MELLQFEPINAHSFVLKSQHYNTPAPMCFGTHWPIREHIIVQNSCLTSSA